MADKEGGIHIDPMSQFLIKPLFGKEGAAVELFSYTNSSLWMTLIVVVGGLLFVVGASGRAVVPTRLQSVTEVLYDFVRKMVRENAGEDGMKYFPIIFTLFTFIIFANVLGLIPYSFTVTSHLAVTATLALGVFVTVTAIGFMKHGAHFLSFFVPKDCPAPLLILLVPIEIISYFVRPISHSIRLGANMLAGHAVLKVFAGFVAPLYIGGALPLGMMVGIYGLEVLVAVLQAYIFTVLTCIYLNDALHMH
ncbi:MAG: F0F1 ATP synthase subunit A [Neomegalonema sp.]|nr:F0F1 ATP synthase subunit A [Neomegalonema sp.]